MHELLDVDQPGRRRQRGRADPLVAQQREHHPQLVLGGPADRLDRVQRDGGLLRALRHQAAAHAGLNGDNGERVGDHVVQFPRDAHAFLADLLTGTLGLGCVLPLRLLGEAGQVAPARRDGVTDEPARRERREAKHAV